MNALKNLFRMLLIYTTGMNKFRGDLYVHCS